MCNILDIINILSGTDGGDCEGAEATINIGSGDEVTIKPTSQGKCSFYVFNGNGGKIEMSLTDGNAGNLIVYLGGDSATGVKICTVTTSKATCEWYDALAVITYTKSGFLGPDPANTVVLKHVP